MHVHSLGHIDNQFDVGVVVVVGSSRDLDILIGHTDVIGVGLEILRSRHDGELNGALIAKSLVGPFPYRSDLLDGGNTVVGDEDLFLRVNSRSGGRIWWGKLTLVMTV
jgi:hypothetical protein